MTPERLRQIANVLDVALELEEDMRPSYLAALGAQDPDLQRLVESHIRAAEGKNGEGEAAGAPTNAETPAPMVATAGHEVGDSIGPYRIVDHLGVGGMGTVYLAEREDEHFERRVAIKILRSGFDSPELIRRFVAERQILAHLEHPNIARLYEGGSTADGRPYLVMEYIDGRPIDRYCDEEKLTIADRIEVIRKVCGAVQYAHRHLIVHRDLKPSNILVDTNGEPKLLDFGIAKLLDPENFPLTVEATRTGLSPMTPHYASPEQVRGESITTSTDVYALGVLLYRLLAGRLPYHFTSGARNHILHTLEKSGPTRPSLVILEDAPDHIEPQPLPLLLGLSPAELQRQLVGDLDSIALKALRPEAEHRYTSPEQLAADLERHRGGLPVLARQGTWRYRVSKFIHRHRVGVGLAAAAALILTALSIFMTWQAAEVAKERNAALAARDAAQTAQMAEKQVVEFLTGLFKTADPRQNRGEDVTAREILDRGAVQVRTELSDRPAVQSRLLATMADVYNGLNLYQESVDLAVESTELRETHGAPDSEIAESRLQEAAGLVMLGKLDESTEALDLAEKALGLQNKPQISAGIASTRGLVAFHRGTFEEAIAFFETALDIQAQQETPNLAHRARTFSNLAYAQEQLSRPDEAEKNYRESLRIAREHLGDDHPLVGNGYNNLGACLKDQGRIEEARENYQKALELRTTIFGDDHLQTAQTRANLAILDAEAGRWRAAIPAFEKTISSFEKHLGVNHPHVAMAWNNLGQCFRQLGEYSAADKALARGLESVTTSVGPDHPIVAQNLLQQSAIHLERGRFGKAHEMMSRIEKILTDSVGKSHSFFVAYRKGLCQLSLREDAQDTVEVCEEALRSNRETYGETHRSSLLVNAFLVEALIRQGDLARASDSLTEAQAVAEATTPEDHPDRIGLLIAHGDLHRARGEVQQATEKYGRALEIAKGAKLTEAQSQRRVAASRLAGKS